MSLLGYLAAGAASGAGQSIATGAQNVQQAWNWQMLNDERAKLERMRDQQLYTHQEALQAQNQTHQEALQAQNQTHAQTLQQQGFEHAENLAADTKAFQLQQEERANRQADARQAEEMAQRERLAGQQNVAQANVARLQAKSAGERQQTEVGGQLTAAMIRSNTDADLARLQAEKEGNRVVHTFEGDDHNLYGMRANGKTVDLHIKAPAQVDKVRDVLSNEHGQLFAITESGKPVNLKMKGMSKQQAATVHSIITDESGDQYAVMSDGTAKALESKESNGLIKGASVTKLPESTKETIDFLKSRISAMETVANDPLTDPDQAQAYRQQADAMSRQVLALLGQKPAPTATMDKYNFGKYSKPVAGVSAEKPLPYRVPPAFRGTGADPYAESLPPPTPLLDRRRRPYTQEEISQYSR